MVSPILTYPPAPRPKDDTRPPAIVHADAYKLFDAVKALKALSGMHAEHGAIERLERDIHHHSNLLNIPLATLKSRYDKYLEDREVQRVERHIEEGCYDGAVVARSGRIKSLTEANNPVYKHYPFHGKAEPKRNVAAVTVHKGHVQNVMFNEDHGLSDGIHALVVA